MSLDIPRIDDINFEQLVAESRARIAVHNPEWTNHTDADPGVTILQLFAFMSESILYRANRIPERNRQKFLRLVGLVQQAASPAEGIVTFDSSKSTTSPIVVPRDSEVRAGPVPFRTERSIDVLPVTAIVCAKTASTQVLDATERARYLSMYEDYGPAADVGLYDTTRLAIPSGGATYNPIDLAETLDQSLWVALLAPDKDSRDPIRSEIAGHTITLGVLPDVEDSSRVLYPQSVQRDVHNRRLTISIPVPEPFDVDAPRLPRYRQLSSVEHADVLARPGTITIELPSDPAALGLWPDLAANDMGFGDFPPVLEERETDRVVTWLRVRRPAPTTAHDSGASQLSLPIAWLGVNAVPVVQQTRVVNERIGRGTGQPDQVVRLKNAPVLEGSVDLRVGTEQWTATDDLATAPPEVSVGVPVHGMTRSMAVSGVPTVFTVESDGTLRFGTGIRGSRPAVGADIVASYSYGGGRDGLLPVAAVSKALSLPAGIKVTNPIRTWGATDTESLTDAESRMVERIKHGDRCVTVDDFLHITKRTPGVSIARCDVLPLFHPGLGPAEAPGTVTVMVVPSFDPLQPAAPRPDQMFIDAVCEHLDSRRLITTEVHVRGPQYVPVTVSIGFDVQPGRDIPPVREAIDAAIRAFFSPTPVGGSTGWPLGKSIDDREVLTEVARVGGVLRVNGVNVSIDGAAIAEPRVLQGLELPHLVGLSVQPGDPTPVLDLTATVAVDPQLLPVPAIPEDC